MTSSDPALAGTRQDRQSMIRTPDGYMVFGSLRSGWLIYDHQRVLVAHDITPGRNPFTALDHYRKERDGSTP